MMQNLKYTVLMSVYYKEKPEYLSLSSKRQILRLPLNLTPLL